MANKQIASADARSRSEFLNKEREVSYVELLSAIDNALIATLDFAALPASRRSDSLGASDTREWASLREAFEATGKAAAKVNLTCSDKICKIVEEISRRLDLLYRTVVSGAVPDRNLLDPFNQLKLDFNRAARADLAADR
ncbi:hypothetical protein ACFYTQ_03200 [Nocardia sp. NPDC004068]|uniref:hypothetical protein n=1 Tax=Nocardia sp. NPDC004068 TaxID=3364303 RepID=UPI0036A6AC7B